MSNSRKDYGIKMGKRIKLAEICKISVMIWYTPRGMKKV